MGRINIISKDLTASPFHPIVFRHQKYRRIYIIKKNIVKGPM
jgi:hypothetical protein